MTIPTLSKHKRSQRFYPFHPFRDEIEVVEPGGRLSIVDAVECVSATTVANAATIASGFGLEWWKTGLAVDRLLEAPGLLDTLGRNDLIRVLQAASNDEGKRLAGIGTEVHAILANHLDSREAPPDDPSDEALAIWRGGVASFFEDYEIVEVIAAESTVYHVTMDGDGRVRIASSLLVAGTLDALVRIKGPGLDGVETCTVDLKTKVGKTASKLIAYDLQYAAQGTIYATASLIADEHERTVRAMPDVSRHLVLLASEKAYRVLDVDLRDEARRERLVKTIGAARSVLYANDQIGTDAYTTLATGRA